MSPELQAIARRRYVSLTTFRRSGVGVPTPVWIAPVDDAVVVMTGAMAGKVKRLRNDARAELRECDSRGRVRPGAPVVLGTAQLIAEQAAVERLLGGHRAKYGWQFRGFRALQRLHERLSASARAKAAVNAHVVLRITDR